ncbi:MAG: winged helix-turn-helix domain-containing protein [Acidobacteriia bacterium]|nr:winged helix-turn-helix domain-containing protein [Terriglobia bacterium]
MIDRKRLARGFRLAGWIVKPEDGSLTSGSVSTRLEPQLMDLLVYLCSRAREVVAKRDVLDAVWGGRFVSDDTVKSSFYQLRKALGDDSRAPKILETLPKRGYRILIDPEPLDAETSLFEKGRAALMAAADPAAFKQAHLYLEKFLETGPDHPGALAALARADVVMASLGFGADFWKHAKASAERAIQFDPRLSDARLALAGVRLVIDHDPRAALAELDGALDPPDSAVLRWRARILAVVGRFDSAIADARRAVEIDPWSVLALRDLLDVLLLARRYDEIEDEASHLFKLTPSAADVHLGLAWVYIIQNKDRQAFDAFVAGAQALGVATRQIDQARKVFESGGIPALLRLWIALLENDASMGRKTQNDLIVLHALLGDRDRSFELIEKTFPQGNPFLSTLAVSPLFDNLRGDPRHGEWIARLGLK